MSDRTDNETDPDPTTGSEPEAVNAPSAVMSRVAAAVDRDGLRCCTPEMDRLHVQTSPMGTAQEFVLTRLVVCDSPGAWNFVRGVAAGDDDNVPLAAEPTLFRRGYEAASEFDTLPEAAAIGVGWSVGAYRDGSAESDVTPLTTTGETVDLPGLTDEAYTCRENRVWGSRYARPVEQVCSAGAGGPPVRPRAVDGLLLDAMNGGNAMLETGLVTADIEAQRLIVEVWGHRRLFLLYGLVN